MSGSLGGQLEAQESERCKAVDVEEGSEGDGGECGLRRTVRKQDPRLPSKDEQQEHELTHLPFRSWCRHCVKGRGKEEPCRRKEGVDGGLPEVHVDYMFMGEEKEGKTLALLVGRERDSRAVMATVVPRKSSGEWAAKRLMAWLRELGYEFCDIIVKSDNEPALTSLVETWGRLRAAQGGQRMVVEHSPVHSSKSNGVVERAIQAVQGMIRTMRSALEDKWGVKLEVAHPVWTWLAEYAGWMLTRGEVGRDGRTAYERIKGKKAKLHGMEFAEGVLWKRRREGGPLGKLTSMWEDGVFLGVKGSTGEIIVGNEKGVWVTRTVRRKPEEERWDRKNIEKIVGVPWRKNDQDKNTDGEAMKGEVRIMDKEYRERMQMEGHEETVPRRVYIKKDDLETFGYTVGCPGCISILKGTARQAHSEACRKRMEEKLKGTERSKVVERRVDEYLEKAIKKDEEKREAKRRKTEGEGGKEGDQSERRELGGDMEVDNGAGSSGDVRVPNAEGVHDDGMVRPLAEKRRNDEAEEEESEEEVSPFKIARRYEEKGAEAEDETMEAKTKRRQDGMDVSFIGETNDEEVKMPEFYEKEEELDPVMVEKGRREEVEFMVKKLDMFEFGSYEEAKLKGEGKEPTTTKWVEGKKMDDDGNEFVRCRLVGRDFKPRHEGPREDLFAAMPPLEAKKALFAMVAGVRGRRRRRGLDEVKIMFIDVKKAHLNAKCDEQEWVRLPAEFAEWGQFARLRRWLYGMRKAASGWEDDYAEKLQSIGFSRGVGAPTVFYHQAMDVRVVVHGDDFTFSGVRRELEKVKAKMADWYDIKIRGIMGSGEEEVKVIKILGRTVRWTAEGIEYEGDERHRVELMKMHDMGEDSNAVGSAAVKPSGEDIEEDEVELVGPEVHKFRRMAAILNYMGQDRSDIQYATKEICGCMARPTLGGLRRIKRAVRYLVGVKAVMWKMREWEDEEEVKVEVFVDSDWAKDASRKSTSGGVLVFGGVAVKHWSRVQKSRALSVGEAEYYALVTGCAEGLGLQSLLQDLGWRATVKVWTDSATAKAVAGRRGLGKLRHVELKFLWVQEVVRNGRISTHKVWGEKNVADHLTKEKMLWDYQVLVEQVGGHFILNEMSKRGLRRREGI